MFPKVDWTEDYYVHVDTLDENPTQQRTSCIFCEPEEPAPNMIYFVEGTSMCYYHARKKIENDHPE